MMNPDSLGSWSTFPITTIVWPLASAPSSFPQLEKNRLVNNNNNNTTYKAP